MTSGDVGRAVLRSGRGARAHPRFTCCPSPQNQKLADRSGVISDVPKCFKIQIFRRYSRIPPGGAYSAPPETLADGKGKRLTTPSQEPHLPLSALRASFYRSQGRTHYRVGNPTNDRFQIYPYRARQKKQSPRKNLISLEL